MGNNAELKNAMKNALKRKELRGYNEAVGGLGLPSKMPGVAYGISAKRCGVGGKLAEQPGSVCHGCYAMKNNYTYPSVKTAHEKRWEALQDIWAWTDNMSTLLQRLGTMLPDAERCFRWHDSGDVQSLEHLDAIVQVAMRNPEWRFWLPTKEYGIVKDYAAQRYIPGNLTVRVSAPVIGQGPPEIWGRIGLVTSTVEHNESRQCPARNQGNECGTCRACWDPQVTNVNYPLH